MDIFDEGSNQRAALACRGCGFVSRETLLQEGVIHVSICPHMCAFGCCFESTRKPRSTKFIVVCSTPRQENAVVPTFRCVERLTFQLVLSDGARSDLASVLACPLLLIAVVSGSGTQPPQVFELLFFALTGLSLMCSSAKMLRFRF